MRATRAGVALICINATECTYAHEESAFKDLVSKDLEAIMAKANLEENKGRWFLFEQVSSTQSAILWAAVAVVLVLAILYLMK